MKRIKFLNCNLDLLTMDETVKYIDDKIQKNNFIQQVVVNVAKLVNLQKDKELYISVNDSDLINIDGMGVIYGAKFLNLDLKKEHKVSGIDLFFNLLQLSELITEFINKNSLDDLNNNFEIKFDEKLWEKEEEVVTKIKNSAAQLLFVAITSPKKENFINKWKKALNVNFVMGVGGTFDIVSGKTKRAPLWMQNSGLEWFYRIIQEPKRMWKRYLITNSIYLYLIIKEKLKKKF